MVVSTVAAAWAVFFVVSAVLAAADADVLVLAPPPQLENRMTDVERAIVVSSVFNFICLVGYIARATQYSTIYCIGSFKIINSVCTVCQNVLKDS